MEIIQNLEWRYATKAFNPNKKITKEQLEILKLAIQLSPSSYGLQPYKVLIIESAEIKEKLKPISWNQSQITDCSHLFVFCGYNEVKDIDIDWFITAKKAIAPTEGLAAFGDFIKTKVKEKSTEEQKSWSQKQAYIAFGILLNTCAALQIDACPMEGFEPDAYNEALGLTEKGLNACVIAAVGFRSDGDVTQGLEKVRKSFDDLYEVR